MNDYQPSPTWVPIAKIQPAYYHGLHEYHRTGAGADIADLTNSIQRHGMKDPLITTSGLELVAGTRRMAAAKSLGLTEVPVIARDNEQLIAALLYDAAHPSEPTLAVEMDFEEKLKHGLLMHRVLGAFFTELKRRRISKNQRESNGKKYQGLPIPDVNADTLLAVLGLTVNQWTKLKFLSIAVHATPPVSANGTFNHNHKRAKYWLSEAVRSNMLDKANVEYGRECRPANWVEPAKKRAHPTDAPATATAQQFQRTLERSAAVLNSTLATVDGLGGVPDKLTAAQLIPLVKEFDATIRVATQIRMRLRAAIKDRPHS